MKKLFRLGVRLSPCLSLVVPLFWMGSLLVLSHLSPNLFCTEMDPGSKELNCGPRTAHLGIQLLQQFGFAVWVLLLVTGGAVVLSRKATWPALIAWSISALMLCSLVMLWMTLSVGDAP